MPERLEVQGQHREGEGGLEEVQRDRKMRGDNRLIHIVQRGEDQGEARPWERSGVAGLDVVDYLATLKVEPEPVLDQPRVREGLPDLVPPFLAVYHQESSSAGPDDLPAYRPVLLGYRVPGVDVL